MAFKMLFFFTKMNTEAPVGGWSEEYYTADTNVGSANGKAETLLKQRLKILAPDVRLDAFRVSDEDNPAVADLEHKWTFGLYKSPGSLAADRINSSDSDWNACLCTCWTGDVKYRRKIMLRGVPAAAAKPLSAAEDTVAADWAKKCQTYLNGLNGIAVIKRLKKPGDKDVVRYPLTALQFNGIIGTATTADASKLSAGHRMHLYHCREFPGAQGVVMLTQVIAPVPPVTGWSLTWNSKVKAGPDYKGQAYMLVVDYTYDPINSAGISGFTHRDTGRPFGLQRGRRPAKK